MKINEFWAIEDEKTGSIYIVCDVFGQKKIPLLRGTKKGISTFIDKGERPVKVRLERKEHTNG